MTRVVPVSFLPWLTTLYLTGLVGVAMFALTQSLQPSADVHAQQTPILNLGSLLPGQPQTRRHKDSAIVFLRLTDAQIETIRSSGPTSALSDPVARNRNLTPDAPATLENRTVDWNGPVFVFDGRCDHFEPCHFTTPETGPVGSAVAVPPILTYWDATTKAWYPKTLRSQGLRSTRRAVSI